MPVFYEWGKFEPEAVCSECGELITETYQPNDKWTMEQYLKLPNDVDVCSESCLIKFLGA